MVAALASRVPCAQLSRRDGRPMPARHGMRVAQRSHVLAPVRRSRLAVRAANDGIDIEKVKETYSKITNAIPPVATAATVPVVALSLLCKTLTGESDSHQDEPRTKIPPLCMRHSDLPYLLILKLCTIYSHRIGF